MTKRLTNDSARKRRPDAWENKAGLTDEQLRRVFTWARQLGYARALELIRAEFTVEPPGITAFGDWYDYFSGLDSEERVHKAIVDGAAVRDLARECGDVSEAMVAVLESEASAAILSGDGERVKLLVGLALKARSGRFEEKKYKDAMKTSIERGLDALAEQAQGNEEALKYYTLFREAVLKSVAEANA
jgi:hypothetical protein